MLDIPRKATLAQVGKTVVSRCLVGCLGQARKRCCNRCCCGLRNYANDVRPTDPLAAGVDSPSQTLAPGVVLRTSTTAGLKYKQNTISRPIEEGRTVILEVGSLGNRFFFLLEELDLQRVRSPPQHVIGTRKEGKQQRQYRGRLRLQAIAYMCFYSSIVTVCCWESSATAVLNITPNRMRCVLIISWV